jgi:3-hydroxybutyryl-CoA dehydratase
LIVGFMSTASTLIIDKGVSAGIDETPVSLGYDRIRFLGPVFIGDTVTVSYTISEIDTVKRQSKSSIEVRNQDDELVVIGTHILRWVKNPAATQAAA